MQHVFSHADVTLGSAAAFFVISKLAFPVGRYLLPGVMEANAVRDVRFQVKWSDHWVALLHAIIASILAVRNVLGCTEASGCMPKDHLFGYSPTLGRQVSLTLGYFVWDLLIILSDLRYYGLAFLVHGIIGFSSFFVGLSPVLMPYAPGFLLYEVSTVFLNLHWILEHVSASAAVCLFNDVLLAASFFAVRLLYGNWLTMCMIGDLFWNRAALPRFVLVCLPLALFAMNALNNFWFVKIVISVRKSLLRNLSSPLPKKRQ